MAYDGFDLPFLLFLGTFTIKFAKITFAISVHLSVSNN